MSIEIKENNNYKSVTSDRPLMDPALDALDHAPLAKHLAEALSSLDASNGFVVSLHGPWGSGKSTLVEFLLGYLKEQKEEKPPIVVRFNPWLFSGQEALIQEFFKQLMPALRMRDENAKEVLNKICDFADALAETPIPFASNVKWFGSFFRLFTKKRDVHGLKKQISDGLKKFGRKIIVIIDDVDRLTKEEIKDIFRLVKSVADFPNIVYLLVFDRRIVVKALEELQSFSGDSYLEKIVQALFELPTPEKAALRNLLFSRLNPVLGSIPEEIANQTYIGNTYIDCVDPFITNPRDVVRLVNSVSITLPAVRTEVNPMDFVAIEALRVFKPDIFDLIRKNQEMFAGASSSRSSDRNDNILKKFHEEWIKDLPEEEVKTLKQLLSRLFPKTKAAWGNTYFGYEWEKEWRLKLQVCSSTVFPVYFRLSPRKTDFSRVELEAILKTAVDENAFADLLVQYSAIEIEHGTSKAKALLSRLEDLTAKGISQDKIEAFIRGLSRASDTLIESEPEKSRLFDFRVDINISRVLHQLLRRLSSTERFSIYEKIAKEIDSLTFRVDEVFDFSQEHGRFDGKAQPDEERLFTLEQVQKLEEISLKTLRQKFADMSILNSRRFFRYCWTLKYLAGEEEVKKWFSQHIRSDDFLLEVLDKALSFGLSQGMEDYVAKKIPRLDPKNLANFFDPDSIVDRARKLSREPLSSERKKIALDQFLKEYELRKAGKNPDSALDD